jgi:predicted Zn-dependent protease
VFKFEHWRGFIYDGPISVMKFIANFSVISVICILSLLTPTFGQATASVPPSNNYIPTTSEFSPRFSSSVTNIVSALTTKDKDKLKSLASEILSQDESNNTRGDEDEKFFLAAFAQRHGGDLIAAAENFQKSIDERQSNPHAHFLLAQTYADLARCQDVFTELDQVRFLLGSEPAASYLLRGQCLAKLNRQPEADTLITSARKAFPSDTQIKKLSLSFKAKAMSLGAILSDTQSAELEGDLSDLAQANPEDSNIQLMYGKSLLKKGDILTKSTELDTAEKIAQEQVKKFNFKNETSVKLLFDVLLKKRKNDEAQEVLNKAKVALPDSKVLADCQKQLEIEVKGLKVLKYDRR